MLAAIIAIDYGTMMGFEGLWAGSFLSNVYEMESTSIGNWLFIMAVGMVVGQVSAGYLSDRVFGGKRKVPIILGTMLYAVNWALLLIAVVSQQRQLLKLLFLSLSITNSMATVPIFGLVADLTPRYVYGTVAGAFNMFPFIGSTAFQGIMGSILDRSGPVVESGTKLFPLKGYLWAFAFCMIAASFAAFLTMFIKERTSSGRVTQRTMTLSKVFTSRRHAAGYS